MKMSYCRTCGVSSIDAQLLHYHGAHEAISDGRMWAPLVICHDCMQVIELRLNKKMVVPNPLEWPSRYKGYDVEDCKVIEIDNSASIFGGTERIIVNDEDYYDAIMPIYNEQQKRTTYKFGRIVESITHISTSFGGRQIVTWSARLTPEEENRYREDHPDRSESLSLEFRVETATKLTRNGDNPATEEE